MAFFRYFISLPLTAQRVLKNKSNLKLTGIDFSKEMNSMASKRAKKYTQFEIATKRENILRNTIPDNSADAIISGFGLKTFSEEQLANLSKEVNRILKPGGGFSFIDVSVPKSRVLRTLYLFYLKYFIPVLGRLFLGNPETYRMLGVYTKLFGNAEKLVPIFSNNGLKTSYKSYFFGCASGVVGRKEN
jgi:demethylmenaquinone methyltransferase/2-methoxy-6-polyprenyl-1,4-benzoquinol methylase